MKTIIVFGATGNLGAYISLHMKNQGYDVIAVGHRKDDNHFFADRGMFFMNLAGYTMGTPLYYKSMEQVLFSRKTE